MRKVSLLQRSEFEGLLGLARRAGAVATGVPAVRDAVRKGDARLVILASDASPTQLKKVQAILEHREIPVRWFDSQSELGAPLGQPGLSAVAITSQSFAEQLLMTLPTPVRTDGDHVGVHRDPKEESSTNAGR